jgi:hypothetical protein
LQFQKRSWKKGQNKKGQILKFGIRKNVFWVFLGFGRGSLSQIPGIF